MSEQEFPTDLPHASDGLHDASPAAFDDALAPPVSEDVELVFAPAAGDMAGAAVAVAATPAVTDTGTSAWARAGQEVVAGLQTLVSAAVYATLIVTFGFQVARVDGLSMAPTLEDHDRLIVNKLVYELGDPRPGDIVMLYYPLNPEKMFVKRVIAKEGDTVRIVDGHVYVNDIPLHDDYVPDEFRSHDDWGPQVDPAGLLLRDGRSPQQQLRQPPLGLGAEEIHRRQGEGALVAASGRPDLLDVCPGLLTCARQPVHRPHCVRRSAAGAQGARRRSQAASCSTFTDADALRALEVITQAAPAGRRARAAVRGDAARRGAHQPHQGRSVAARSRRFASSSHDSDYIARVAAPAAAGAPARSADTRRRPSAPHRSIARHAARAALQDRRHGRRMRRREPGDARRSVDGRRAGACRRRC